MNAPSVMRNLPPLSASEGTDRAGTRPDDGYCHCAEPDLRDDDPVEFCWHCRRYLRDDDDD